MSKKEKCKHNKCITVYCSSCHAEFDIQIFKRKKQKKDKKK